MHNDISLWYYVCMVRKFRHYSKKTKMEVISLYKVLGPTKLSKRFDIPYSTIARWNWQHKNNSLSLPEYSYEQKINAVKLANSIGSKNAGKWLSIEASLISCWKSRFKKEK